jgi:hypothetical protein
MRKLTLLLGIVVLAVGSWTTPLWAAGSLPSVFVDPESGADSATCGGASLATAATGPCLTLNQGLTNAATGATIYIMKPGVFGPVVLGTQIFIIGPPGGHATIQWAATLPGCVAEVPGSCNSGANASYAVEIKTDVRLQNILIDNATGTHGAMHIGLAADVFLNDVILRGGSTQFAGQLMLIDSSQGQPMQLYLDGCDFGFAQSNNGVGGGGIVVAPTGNTPVTMSLNHSKVHHTTFGLQVNAGGLTGGAGIAIDVDNTQLSYFSNSAISMTAASAATPVNVIVSRSNLFNTGGAAIKANGAGAAVSLYASSIVRNSAGVNLANGATVFTSQNNDIALNGTNCEVSGVATPCSSALTAMSQQ